MANPKTRGDRQALQKTMDAILDASRASKLESRPSPQSSLFAPTTSTLPNGISELVFDVPTHRRLDDLVLSAHLKENIEEFIYEFSHSALLREHSVEPRHTLLLIGPPGNGKTSLAEVIAAELALPLLSVRYDAIVDSFLGETANRFRRLIDFVATNPSVLFFDEFDAVGKDRGDSQETGEIKRVVSSLLVQLDRLPSHSVVICATNHPELLDKAVWRRFEVRVEVPLPGESELKAWFRKFENSLGASAGIDAQEFADCMAGESMSEIEAFTLDVRRKLILSRGKLTPAHAVEEILERWQRRLRKNVRNGDHGSELSGSETAERAAERKTNKGTGAARNLRKQKATRGTE
ncbi:AAA family ATPase [Paraburkholderia hospita]|uniref:AAA family ATPase n=1 Tax=Paraburkholderia hospita TaxID=169430 RepID=UPI0009C43511|nr:ATP-binding protein [Paraburkholderia hospita]SKC53370.1 ATPase family associated with various cellular activities (AAA) [Paraburkholderia hospita]